MTKTNRLSVALMTAALLTAPTMARQDQLTSHRLIANARVTMTAHGADEQTCWRKRASNLRRLAERDVWGYWGAYYGPMVPTFP